MEDDVRIMVVDDMPDSARALREVLTLSGYSVRIAHGGVEALQLIDCWQPHCMLFDVYMPGLNGLELAQAMRKHHGDSVVLIAITGGDERDPIVKQTFDMVDYYLQKPDYLPGLMKVLPPLAQER